MTRWTCVGLAAALLLVPTLAKAQDDDGDGYPVGIDCDDTDSSIFPGNDEICGDGIDQNCGNDHCWVNPYTGIEDCFGGDLPADGDGDGFDSVDCWGTDCDDRDHQIYPGALERCDGIDGDCDGSLPAEEADLDGDGTMACAGDCNDDDAALGPDGTETALDWDSCIDGVDNDCDGGADGADFDCQLPPEPRVEGRIEVDYLGGVQDAIVDASATTDPNPDDTLIFTWELQDDGVELLADGPMATLRFVANEEDPGPWAFWVDLWIDDGAWLVGPLPTVVAFYRVEEEEAASCTHASAPPLLAVWVLALIGIAVRRRRA